MTHLPKVLNYVYLVITPIICVRDTKVPCLCKGFTLSPAGYFWVTFPFHEKPCASMYVYADYITVCRCKLLQWKFNQDNGAAWEFITWKSSDIINNYVLLVEGGSKNMDRSLFKCSNIIVHIQTALCSCVKRKA